MNPAHTSYYRHVKRKYLMRVYPPTDDSGKRRALRFPKKTYFGGYFVTVTEQQLVEEFERVKHTEVPEKFRA